MKPEPTTLYPTDDCMIDGFSEDFPMCQLIRDESLGWPQDPELDTDPFSSKLGLDLDSFSVFDSANSPRDWNIKKENAKEWNVKELTQVPDTWQQFPTRSPSPDTSLTPALAALEFPKGPMPEELDSQNYCQKMEEGQSPIRQQSFGMAYPQIGEEFAQNNSLSLPTNYAQYQRGPQEGIADADVVTIGIYTRSERAAKIFRYRQKRARRNYTKRVLYNCRKRFADSRPRVGGRFVINENRVIKPKIFLKRGRPRKTAIPLINYLASSSFIVE